MSKEMIKQAREWLKDAVPTRDSDESIYDTLPAKSIIHAINRYYEGGVKAFVRDSGVFA